MPVEPEVGDPGSRLADALTALDLAVRDVGTVGVLVDGCGRCYGAEDLRRLSGPPSRVPAALVASFTMKDPYHWAPIQYGLLWRRLAGRVVRLLVATDGSAPEWLLRGLGTAEAGCAGWPAVERDALLEALDAVLVTTVVVRRDPAVLLDLLGGLAWVHDDLAPWLRRIEELTGPGADAAVVRAARSWAVDLGFGESPSGFRPGDRDEACLRAWLCSAPVDRRVRDFAAAHPGCRTAADGLIALDALRRGIPGPWLYPGYRGVRDIATLLAPC